MSQDALQLMSMPGELRLSSNGIWFHNDIEVTHSKISRYFFAHLVFSKEHNSYVIEQNGRCLGVVVEDTAQFVRTIEITQGAISGILSDGTIRELDPIGFSFHPIRQAYYVKLEHDKAKLLRPALQRLIPHIEDSSIGVCLNLFGEMYPITIESNNA